MALDAAKLSVEGRFSGDLDKLLEKMLRQQELNIIL